MITVKQLKEFLGVYSDNTRVINERGEDICHLVNISSGTLVISASKPIGMCLRCGEYVYRERGLDYEAYCPSCDENMYGFEIEEIE